MSVNVLRAVVRVKAENPEGETLQQFLQYRDQESLADAFAARYALVLGDAINGVDVIHTFEAIRRPDGHYQPASSSGDCLASAHGARRWASSCSAKALL